MKSLRFPTRCIRFTDEAERSHRIRNAALGTLFLLVFAGSAHGAEGVWSKEGGGAWHEPLNWTGVVPDGSGDSALFVGAGYNVDLTGGVTLGRLEVQDGTATPGWILSGGSLTLSGLGGATPVISNDGSGTTLRIDSVLAGNHGFTKEGSGRLVLANAGNTLTGDISINEGTLSVSSAGVVAGSRIIFGGGGTSTFSIAGSGNYQNEAVLDTLTSSISVANSNLTYSGVISELGGPRDLVFYAGGTSTITVSGSNTYTGNTAIGSNTATLRVIVTNDDALGRGSNVAVTLYDNSNDLLNALVLSGGVHIAGKSFTLKGRGIGAAGSLVSSDGENVWDGDISLGTGRVSSHAATIGVNEGSLLTVKGVISNPVAQTQGLAKVGLGTLVLDGDNSYGTGTAVAQGTLVVNGSLAAGGEVTVHSGATLAVAGVVNGDAVVESGGLLEGGTHAGEIRFGSDLTLAAGSNTALRFKMTGEGLSHDQLLVDGTLTLSLGGTLTVDAAGLSSSHVGMSYTLAGWGALDAGGFDVSEDLVFVNLDPSLTILTGDFLTNGTVTVIPEPSLLGLLFGGFCAAGVPLLRRRGRLNGRSTGLPVA